MAAIVDTEQKLRNTDVNEVAQYLQQENVVLNTRQIQALVQMNLTLQDLRNMNLESDFGEMCRELNLSFGPKIKLKSAIKKLQSLSIRTTGSKSSDQKEADTQSNVDRSHVERLIAMGFNEQNAIFALEMNQNDLSKAIEILTNESIISFSAKYDSSKPIKTSDTTNSRNATVSPFIPIGCIIAWYKDFGQQSQTLPSCWIECNGQIIGDQHSILHGQQVPNLNQEGRFLRGGTVSGVMQDDQVKKHSHNGNFQIKNGGVENVCWNLGARSTWKSGPVSETGGDETRPKNMSVVWIMRIE